MKLTKEDEAPRSGEGPLIVERSLKLKKEPASGSTEVGLKNEKCMRQPEMTEDNSVVSAYPGGDEERSVIEKKTLRRRQEAGKKTKMNKSNKDISIDSLAEGMKECSIDKDKNLTEEDDLSGKLSSLSLKRQEPREDDERGDDLPPTEEEAKEPIVAQDQKWARLEERTQEKETTDGKKKVVQKRGPMGGVAVFGDRSAVNNGFNGQQISPNDPNSLAWHHLQQQQLNQQQALVEPQNFPNYQNFQSNQQYVQGQGVASGNLHSKRGFDFDVQDVHCGEAPKYFRPQQMPQNNLDAPGTPLSPTSFNKSVSTVCTKQMAGATMLQQNTLPTPVMSPMQQQQHQHHHHQQQQQQQQQLVPQQQQVWNKTDYPLPQQSQQQRHHHHQPLLQGHHQHRHHQSQQRPQHNLQSEFFPTNDLGPDFTFLDVALNNPDGVGDVVDEDGDIEKLLDRALAVHKGQGDATILQKDLEPILSVPSVASPKHQFYNTNPSTLPQTAAIDCITINNSTSTIPQHRNSQDDTGYATDQSPIHDSSQYSPGPQSVMEASPAASSGIGSSPPSHHNNWSPPPSNLSEMSQDSGVCSPMSEDGKTNGGQVNDAVGVPNDTSLSMIGSVGGYIVPPVQDPLSRLAGVDDLYDSDLYLNSYVDDHLEDLKDAVSVMAKDVQNSLLQQTHQALSPQSHDQQQQALPLSQQPPQQNQFVYHQQQLQQQALSKPVVGSGGVGGAAFMAQQAQQTTNLVNGSGGIMVNNCPPPQLQPTAVVASSAVIPQSSAVPVTVAAMQPSQSIMVPNNNNGKMMVPAVSTLNSAVVATTTTANININNNQHRQSPAALVFTSTTTTPTGTPPPNANGKLPIPPTPRRSQNIPQGSTPMIPAVGIPQNGQMTALIIIPPQKPRFPNIAPKDPTKQNAEAANNNGNSSNNINRASSASPGSGSPPTAYQPPLVSNGNNGNGGNGNGNSPPNPANANAQSNANRRISRLNCARRSVARLVRKDLEYTDGEGDTNLHVAVCRTDHTDPYLIQALLERLVREKLSPMMNAQNNAGQTPLYLAVSSNDPQKVKVLVDKGADVTLYAETRGYNGAKEKMAAIHCASSKGQGYLTTLKALLTAPGIQVDQTDSQNYTALHRAILCHGETKGDNQQINSLPVIETLVAAGANLNLQVQNGRTALMFGLETANIDLIERLFSLVEPENRQQCLRTQDVKGLTVMKIAERVKVLLSPTDQQRLHNALKRGSAYQRSSYVLGSPVAGNDRAGVSSSGSN